MDGTGTSSAVSEPHEKFFNTSFRIWIGGVFFQMVASDQSGCTKYGGL